MSDGGKPSLEKTDSGRFLDVFEYILDVIVSDHFIRVNRNAYCIMSPDIRTLPIPSRLEYRLDVRKDIKRYLWTSTRNLSILSEARPPFSAGDHAFRCVTGEGSLEIMSVYPS